MKVKTVGVATDIQYFSISCGFEFVEIVLLFKVEVRTYECF
jgi:hypothetical protein